MVYWILLFILLFVIVLIVFVLGVINVVVNKIIYIVNGVKVISSVVKSLLVSFVSLKKKVVDDSSDENKFKDKFSLDIFNDE